MELINTRIVDKDLQVFLARSAEDKYVDPYLSNLFITWEVDHIEDLVVAKEDGVIVGYALMLRTHPHLHLSNRDLLILYVDPKRRNQGIGSSILKALQITYPLSITAPDNNKPFIRIVNRCKFRPMEELTF